jgi:hypothetical protein
VFGPENATLSVRTGRTGAAAKAGHDLLLTVTAWQATLEVGEQPSLTLQADARSLRVVEGTGGLQSLGDEEKSAIEQIIDDEVLKGTAIAFRSSAVEPAPDGGRLGVRGELTLAEKTAPLEFDLAVGAGGALSGSAVLKQTDWGMTPYSTLFGTLKVADDVTVELEAQPL